MVQVAKRLFSSDDEFANKAYDFANSAGVRLACLMVFYDLHDDSATTCFGFSPVFWCVFFVASPYALWFKTLSSSFRSISQMLSQPSLEVPKFE